MEKLVILSRFQSNPADVQVVFRFWPATSFRMSNAPLSSRMREEQLNVVVPKPAPGGGRELQSNLAGTYKRDQNDKRGTKGAVLQRKPKNGSTANCLSPTIDHTHRSRVDFVVEGGDNCSVWHWTRRGVEPVRLHLVVWRTQGNFAVCAHGSVKRGQLRKHHGGPGGAAASSGGSQQARDAGSFSHEESNGEGSFLRAMPVLCVRDLSPWSLFQEPDGTIFLHPSTIIRDGPAEGLRRSGYPLGRFRGTNKT